MQFSGTVVFGRNITAASVKSAVRVSCSRLFLHFKLSSVPLLASHQVLPESPLLPSLPSCCCRKKKQQPFSAPLNKFLKGEQATLKLELTLFVLNKEQMYIILWPASRRYFIKMRLFPNTCWQRGITSFQFAYKCILFYWCIVRRIYYEQLT